MLAYFVVGPESSGTRLMTRILIAAGCRGSGGEVQPFDQALPAPEQSIVWRRSVPYAREWPDIPACVRRLRDAGYWPIVVVTLRGWYPCRRSQVSHGHVANVQVADAHIERAYLHIFRGVTSANVPYRVVLYEELVQRPDSVLGWLLPELGLDDPLAPVEAIRDENTKWWGVPICP